jgi:GntR family transcriptional repressor for pyruvate dehydrogenase complex
VSPKRSEAAGQPGVQASAFDPLERRSMVSDTTRMIKSMIIDGRLKPGDRLPSERVLCEALGVSRPTLREAITTLVAMKILIAQAGSGTYVSSLDAEDLLEPMQFVLALSHSNYDQLFEARCALEPEVAALAALRATPEELEALSDCVARTKAWRGDLDELERLDQELHRLVAEASHNGILVNVLKSMSSLAAASRRTTVRLPGIAKHTTQDHIAIGDAVLRRDADAARKAMDDHLRGIQRRISAEMSAGGLQDVLEPPVQDITHEEQP